jgi:TRAP-type transport system periplasmic protein
MRAIRWIATFLGPALVAVGCTAEAPNRAVAPGSKPIVLTLASPLSTPVLLDAFVNEVTILTGGSVRIDVKGSWRVGEVDYETGLIADVKAGKADLGAVSSRAFDSAGVASLRPLAAPLLITSYAAEEKVLRSPVVNEMLGGLDAAGLTGLGILPGDLRHPMGITTPLVKPSDYAGRTIGTQQSTLADETMRALGATPVRFAALGKIDAFDGIEQQISAIEGSQYDKAGRFLTANVAWWPRPLVLITTDRVLRRLSAAQRQALTNAAAATLPASLARVQAVENEALGDLCRAGRLALVEATPGDIAALRTAVQPVYDELDRDPSTKQAIAAMSATVHDVVPEPPPVCGATGPSPAHGSAQLDGVYTRTTKFGDDPSDTDIVPENYGSFILVLRAGHFAATQHYQKACTWGYGTFTVTGAQMAWTFTDGGGISPTGAINKPGELFTYGWSLYRDTLTLTPVDGAISPGNFRIKPWHRISTTPSATYLNKNCPPPANALG